MIPANMKQNNVSHYIASLKHTHHHSEHIVWWGPDKCGYTPVVGPNIGRYDAEAASKLNDGVDCIAVPVDAVETLLTPTPYYKPGARFYDQIGPVVDNTRNNWNALIGSSVSIGRVDGLKVKPETFRGKRRSFSEAAA